MNVRIASKVLRWEKKMAALSKEEELTPSPAISFLPMSPKKRRGADITKAEGNSGSNYLFTV